MIILLLTRKNSSENGANTPEDKGKKAERNQQVTVGVMFQATPYKEPYPWRGHLNGLSKFLFLRKPVYIVFSVTCNSKGPD